MLWEQNLCLLLEADNQMFTPAPDTSADLAIALLIHYSFDLSGYSANEIVNSWQKQYPLNWLHFAVIEALYQGRYKAVSVQQILNLWQRRGQATFHFNMEFETMICSKFPEKLTSVSVKPTVEKNQPKQQFTLQQGNLEDSRTPKRGNAGSIEEAEIHKKGNAGSVEEALNSKDLGKKLTPPVSSDFPPSDQEALPPLASNHPPIGQFTPETSACSDSFTSKLKAMSNSKLPSINAQEDYDSTRLKT
ncbi:MAG: hypothetical protein PUP91_33205 [Rhizonema sp. PD37]|nr:hypothetical protein [Rhizonema sp. PD37]